MNKNKFEEGETCDDSTVDPDIALSYIDEKLQDVLGHFQKDFEDGVSSENLGSKFGGYGSFLPTYQRSPSWTCTKTPPDAYNNNRSTSPSSLRPEGGRRPSSASSSASLSGRPLASSAYSSTIVPTLKAPAANGKTNSSLQPAQDEDSTSRSELVKKPTNLSDKKAPKLHARIGIKKFSTQKKAEIYSGLGLDVSPSSSLDDSPISSEGLSHDLKDSRYESPTSILQNSGSSESTGIYFQAALKFLHGASLLELDSSKHGEQNQSRSIYSSTAKLCQFCGHEYEKLRDMAAAALAYKCMEVAYMRVIYSSQSDANRYRNELQTALQIFPPVDMAASAKVVGSPQVAGTHVISAGNGSSFTQLINLAQAVNFAMEASRKSRVAFAAVYPGPGDSQCKEGALSVKKALDFNFQDVDGLLRLVRVAMEAISH